MPSFANYKVARGWFGQYKQGSVIPEWVVARAGSVEESVRLGIVEPTNDPVNVTLRIPEPKPEHLASDPPPQLVDEANKLRTENLQLAADLKDAHATVAALRKQLETRDKSLVNQTEVVEHMRTANEEHQNTIERLEKRLEELTAELEQLTAPAAA